jgi:hypothetical protein
MKIKKKESAEIVAFQKKIRDFFGDDLELMDFIGTLLGAADNISQYILEKEVPYNELPSRCKYGMLHLFQILNLVSGILGGRIKRGETKIGGYFPAGKGAWKSEEDFEARLVLLVKMFHADLTAKGKI